MANFPRARPAHHPNTSSLAKFIWGEANLKRRCELLEELTKHEIFTESANPSGMSRADHWAFKVKQARALIDVWLQKGWSPEHFVAANRIIPEMPCFVQFRIFLKNLQAQMSPEQKAYWIPRVERFEVLGCYAQTEVGHGSNVRGIETQATFDLDTDEFILASPTVSSSKIWIGGLGAWATHAIVVARLIVNHHDYGNHLFLVQVRDLDTHDVLPGISIYEQRDKVLGTLRGVDNGVMRFYNHRIPRSNMFAGSASLSRDGVYTPPNNQKHSYTSMVIIRGLMSSELAFDAMKCLYIAAHYALFRRQFGAETPGDQETAIIEYASVKERLLPAIARELAIILNGRRITELIDKGLGTNMEDLHILTVGGKVYASEHSARDCEMARLLCGGHGHHQSAGFGAAYTLLSAGRTYEGDSYVISLQLARAVKKASMKPTEQRLPALDYLQRKENPLQKYRRGNDLDWFDHATQDDFLGQRAAIIAEEFLKKERKGKDTSFHSLELTMAHTDLHYVRGFRSALENSPAEARVLLIKAANLFALNNLINGLSTFAGSSDLDYNQVQSLKAAYEKSLVEFEPHVFSLLEAFSFTPLETKSTLCPVDKTPYEALVDWCKGSELNDTESMRPTILEIRSLWKRHQASPSRL